MGSSNSTTERTQDHHCPTPEDVFAVRSFLLAFVPAELANLILNEANYWPKATLTFEPENPLVIEASSNQNNAHACCLVTSKLCDLLYDGKDGPFNIKTICFKIVSHDQGWCSNHFSGDSGRYEGSFTWFEAVIVRDFINQVLTLGPPPGPSCVNLETERIHQALDEKYPHPNVVTVKFPDDDDSEKNSDKWNIQRNVRASDAFQLHTVVWTEGEEVVDGAVLMNGTGRGLGRGFVRSLMKEDRIVVMARAQYPGWVNYIKSVEMEIYYCV